jgi:mono/diheme cytochrome c family protein
VKPLVTLLSSVAFVGAASAAAIQLGLAPVAATEPHWEMTRWVLSTAMERGVQRRALDVAVPDDLDLPARVRAGASAYDAMCAVCHGAPGVEPGALVEGLLPGPPELAEEAEEWTAAELFWITKHGIRMTGMAAFGPTHEDSQIWDIVAFLQRLPYMSASEYRSLAGAGAQAHHH